MRTFVFGADATKPLGGHQKGIKLRAHGFGRGSDEFSSARLDQIARRRSPSELGPEVEGGTTDEDCVVRDERETPTNRGGGDP